MATDLHENISGTGLGILGGDFERKSLKTQIKIFGENRVALTELNIRFEQTLCEFCANNVTDQIQKFVFPFSDDKNC